MTRRVQAILAGGAVMAIAGEGRIHASESELWPIDEGTAFFALRASVPIVPIAINGTSWLHLGARVSVRVGEPIEAVGRADRETVQALTERTWAALHDMVRDAPDVPVPGRFGRWLTERFNDWPEGSARGDPGGRPGPPARAAPDRLAYCGLNSGRCRRDRGRDWVVSRSGGVSGAARGSDRRADRRLGGRVDA